MSINQQEIEHIADLAMLTFADGEKERFTRQIGTILSYVGLLNQLDTAAVPPTSSVVQLQNAFRDDLPLPTLDRDRAFNNAPQKSDSYFLVPPVIE